MARWEIKNVGMKGVAMAVPKNVVTTSELGLLSQEEAVLCPLRHFPRALLQNPMDPHKPSRTVPLFHGSLPLGYSQSAETFPFPVNISPVNRIA